MARGVRSFLHERGHTRWPPGRIGLGVRGSLARDLDLTDTNEKRQKAAAFFAKQARLSVK